MPRRRLAGRRAGAGGKGRAAGGDGRRFRRLLAGRRPVGRVGVRGGFFHPTTGYSLPDAVRTAMLLPRRARRLSARQRALGARLERGFYRLLDRMLFRAAEPPQRYRVLEHFYRLDPALIARFYAGRSTLADKARILAGKPARSYWPSRGRYHCTYMKTLQFTTASTAER